MKINNIRHYWYTQTYILMEIVKLSKGRELTLLPADTSTKNRVRCINASFVDILKKNFDAFHFITKNFNLYYSLAHLKGNWGLFSFSPPVRKQQQAVFNKSFNNFFDGFDLGVDFDGNLSFGKDLMYFNGEKVMVDRKYYGKEGIIGYDILQNGSKKHIKPQFLKELPKEEQIDRAKKDLLILKKEMDDYKIPYSVKFSGNKGFHLNIDDKNFPDIEPQKKVIICDKLTKEFSKILNLPTIDTSLCQDRRIWALPYSLKGTKVCLPLTDLDINDFELKNMEALMVLKNVQIKNRGLLERNNDSPLEDLKENFKRLLKDYEIRIK